MTGLEVLPLTPANLDDLFGFFEGPAFADNPHWRGCYCLFNHQTGDFDPTDGVHNRPGKAEQVRREGGFGLLAYQETSAAGWCNCAPNPSLRRLEPFGVPQDPAIATIVCFVVRPDLRRSGVASALLGAAPAYARSLGCTALDAYPLPEPAGPSEQISAEGRNYHGFASMYRAAGFDEVATAGPFLHLRLPL